MRLATKKVLLFWLGVIAVMVLIFTPRHCYGQVDTSTLPSIDSALIVESWSYALVCTGLTPQPGGRLSDVKWRVARHNSLAAGHRYLGGLWSEPESISIDERFITDRWIIIHELLHHLLRGPPADQGGPHPWTPFAFPCNAMPFQHAAGGIMGDSRGR